ncbi:ATP-binding protein [Streptomyces paludis]|uniref:ATP-binding protein n=1 Tax=Streptomyces paludis TaxID=2282738 RepID=A0A345HRI0_9ACTN|nr:ATP-binding protein [Streptomyces paludis]AXG79304.1 ATP-binding protein [Streptomyces paludis]
MTTVTATASTAPPPLLDRKPYLLTLPNTAAAPKIARNFVSSLLGIDRRHHALVEDARLCVTEVVTNAHRHTQTPLIRVSAALEGGRVTVAVTDDRPWVLPVPTVVVRGQGQDGGGDQSAYEEGRGIALVAHLAHAWGTTIYASDPVGRKAIWFTLESPGWG